MSALELVAAFDRAERHLVSIAGTASDAELDAFHQHFTSLVSRAKADVKANHLPLDLQSKLIATTRSIRAIAAQFCDIERSAISFRSSVTRQTSAILHDHTNSSPISVPPTVSPNSRHTDSDDEPPSNDTKFRPCAEYFLAHLSSPYPSSDEKKRLVAETESDASSIRNWFTNNRRRSGWTTIMKEHAGNNKEQMRLLVENALNPSSSQPAPAHVYEAIVKARDFFSRLVEPEISDVFRQALAMKPMSPEEVEEYQKKRHATQRKISELVKSAGKRKRSDENDVDEEPPFKRASSLHLDAQDASPDSFLSKRKRSDDADDAATHEVVGPSVGHRDKRVRTAPALRERLPRTRYVLDDAGNPRKLRRKPQFRFAPTSVNIVPTPTAEQPAISPLVVKKRKHNSTVVDDAPSPRLPTSHKRRKLPTGEASRSVSTAKATKPKGKGKQRQQPRATSAPTATRETPFFTPENNAALQNALRSVSGPSEIPAYGAAAGGDAILPPLTAQQFEQVFAAANASSIPSSSYSTINSNPQTFAPSQPFSDPFIDFSQFAPGPSSSQATFDSSLNGFEAAMFQPTHGANMFDGSSTVHSQFATPHVDIASLVPPQFFQPASEPQGSFEKMLYGSIADASGLPASFADMSQLTSMPAPQPMAYGFDPSMQLNPDFSTASFMPSNDNYFSDAGSSQPPSLSHSPARSVSPTGSMDMFVQLERKRCELAEKQRVAQALQNEAEKQQVELDALAAACIQTLVDAHA